MVKPIGFRTKHKEFLDLLHSTKQINMHSAGPMLQDHFELSAVKSRRFLYYWIENFMED